MKKKALLFGIVTLLVLTAALGIRWADREGKFDLLQARIDNSGPVDSALVAEILRPWFEESLLRLNADSLGMELETIDGVASASVRVVLPHSIVVELHPREAVAMVLSGAGSTPVTMLGEPLPDQWADPALPELRVLGNPEESSIRAALNLALKRDLGTGTEVTVLEDGIQVVENGIPVLLRCDNAPGSWRTWNSIRDSVRPFAEQVDLRYRGQAIVRPSGGETV